eukprot:403343040
MTIIGFQFLEMTSTLKKTQGDGGHCLLSNQEVYKTFHNLPKSHSRILITATLHFIDNWQGEAALVSIDDQVAWMKTVKASEYGVDLCGNNSFKEAAFNVPVIIDTNHAGDKVKVTFKTNIKGDACEKSLGIDNVEIYVK